MVEAQMRDFQTASEKAMEAVSKTVAASTPKM
jgi:hypothetical protein